MRIVEQESILAAAPEAVWARVSTFEGINDELRPLMRMTAPARVRALDPAEVVLGERIFRSWILLFGLIPIDYDDLSLIALEPGRGFHERSTMLSMRAWEHERWLESDGDGRCRLRDRLSFEPRAGFAGPVLERFIVLTFRHRHRRLQRFFERQQ
jgi:ligand-binding SRPBCC domain-containing protein